MKKMRMIKKFIALISLITGLTLFSQNCISANSPDGLCRGDVDSSYHFPANTDTAIKLEKISNNLIIVKLDYDAVTAVSTKNGIVVLDAGISTGLTRKYRKLIEAEFNRNDFDYVIHSHGHFDHTGGNLVFQDAKIVGHENCIQEISEQWKNPEKVKLSLSGIISGYEKELNSLAPGSEEWNEAFCQKTRYQNAFDDFINNRRPLHPSLTFRDTLNIITEDVTFNLIYFGKAHSTSDILVHLPEMKLLMVGDLFSKYGRPSLNEYTMRDSGRWIQVMQWLEPRLPDINMVIGGHGTIMTKEDLLSFMNYIRKIAEH